MKRVAFLFITFIITLLSLAATPHPINAANEDCDPWYLNSVQCLKEPLKKAGEGALNKQAGDIGTAYFNAAFIPIAAIGLCDDESNPDCPKGTGFKSSAMAGLTSLTLAMYQNPPANTSLFIADIGNTLGFMPKAQAQGIGFSGLAALLNLWKAFRNVAYALLAAIMIIVGFMVMFRKKIDPKTVVTVQNAIPRIVIALLLVTFSYAIVGVMIDLMYLAIVLAVSLIYQANGADLGKAVTVAATGGGQPTVGDITSIIFTGGGWGLFRMLFGSGLQAYDDIASWMTGGFDGWKVAAATVLPSLFGSLFGLKGAWLGLTNGPVLLFLILVIVLLFGFVRIFFMLIDAYINIIISLLVAPFQLMMEAVPGTNAFAMWFKHLLSKILVFPLTATLLMISAVLTSQNVSKGIWSPPFLSSGTETFGMAGIIGLGMLLVIPTVVAGFQKALKAEPLVPGGLSTIVGPLGSGVGQIFSMVYQGSFVASAFRHKPEARTPYQIVKEGGEKGVGAITGGGASH